MAEPGRTKEQATKDKTQDRITSASASLDGERFDSPINIPIFYSTPMSITAFCCQVRRTRISRRVDYL